MAKTIRKTSAAKFIFMMVAICFVPVAFLVVKPLLQSLQTVSLNLGQCSQDMFETVPELAMKKLADAVVNHPNAGRIQIIWGFSNIVPNTDYFENRYEYNRVAKTFLYDDDFGLQIQYRYTGVDDQIILKIAAARNGTYSDLPSYGCKEEKIQRTKRKAAQW